MNNEDIKMSECCTCGTKWRAGQDGRHSCTQSMALRIKELEEALNKISELTNNHNVINAKQIADHALGNGKKQ